MSVRRDIVQNCVFPLSDIYVDGYFLGNKIYIANWRYILNIYRIFQYISNFRFTHRSKKNNTVWNLQKLTDLNVLILPHTKFYISPLLSAENELFRQIVPPDFTFGQTLITLCHFTHEKKYFIFIKFIWNLHKWTDLDALILPHTKFSTRLPLSAEYEPFKQIVHPGPKRQKNMVFPPPQLLRQTL